MADGSHHVDQSVEHLPTLPVVRGPSPCAAQQLGYKRKATPILQEGLRSNWEIKRCRALWVKESSRALRSAPDCRVFGTKIRPELVRRDGDNGSVLAEEKCKGQSEKEGVNQCLSIRKCSSSGWMRSGVKRERRGKYCQQESRAVEKQREQLDGSDLSVSQHVLNKI